MDKDLRDMHERLVDHMDGVSVDEEKQAVSSLIAADPVWAKAWEDLKETRSAILHFGLRQKVALIHEEMENERSTVKTGNYRRMIRPFLSVAAFFIFLVAGYYFYRFYTISPEKVFSSNYVTYDQGTLRGTEDHPSAVEQAFQKKDHVAVLLLMAGSASSSPKDKFLAGISCLELKNYAGAKTYFKDIIGDKQGNGLFKDEAEYYLALASIATKEYGPALSILKKIRDEKQHPYHQEVTDKLIQDVKMLSWK